MPAPGMSAAVLYYCISQVTVVAVQSLSHVQLLATPWTTASQAPLSVTVSQFVQVHVHWISDAI